MENHITNIPRSALDFKGYGELKAKASRNEKMATKEVARQFEAMFVQMMLKSMRAAVSKNEEHRSKTMETFEQMYDREIAVAMSRKGGLGLAKMIETHLDKINVSSKSFLENRFELNKSYPLNQKNKALKLRNNSEVSPIPLRKKVNDGTLQFKPLTNEATTKNSEVKMKNSGEN